MYSKHSPQVARPFEKKFCVQKPILANGRIANQPTAEAFVTSCHRIGILSSEKLLAPHAE
jgi:hypothetical protein